MTDINLQRLPNQDVLERLLERIRNGDIAPGAPLPAECELMAQYGVAATDVRAALQSLERSGIVELVEGEPARVVAMTADRLITQIAAGAMHLLHTQPDMMRHLLEARVCLECCTARMAAMRATPRQVERLQRSVEEHRASMINLDEFMERDMAFHRAIADISGNPIFPSIVESMFRWASKHYLVLVRAPGAEELTLFEHQRIVNAIAKHDGDGAEEAMRSHLTRASELYGEANRL